MKISIPVLALSLALLPLVNARAAETKASPHSTPASQKLSTRVKVEREAAPPRAALPVDVAAQVPVDAQSLHFARYPLGPNGAPRLVYVWFDPSHGNTGGPHSSQCVFEVAVFAPGATGRWKRASSASYKSSNWPDFIEVRFQQPRLRRGAVVALWCSTDYPFEEVNVAILRDANAGATTSGPARSGRGVVQRFAEYDGHSQRLGLDARGFTAVVETVQQKGKPAQTKVFAWNGAEYAARPAKR